jgi:apolipoprotein N-acyltransferase
MKSLPVGVSLRDGASALGIAVLSALSFPPFGLWPLSLAAVCLFLLLIRNANAETARNVGLLYGLFYGFGTMYWLFDIFNALAVPLIAIFAAYFGILSTLIAVTRDKSPCVRAVLVGLLAVGIEWLRGDAWYLRFPWYTVPHALALHPEWIAPVRWLGTYGFSFLIWFLAAWGAFQHLGIWLAFALVPLSAFLLPEVGPADRKAVLLQPSEASSPASFIRSLCQSSTKDINLAVLPEYAYQSSPESVLAIRDGPADLARQYGCPVVFGAREEIPDSGTYYNVAVVINEKSETLGTFPKQRPVPLFRDGRPGVRRPVFPVEDGILGVAVCYDFDAQEIAATLVSQGATVLVAPMLDAMSWGQIQHIHHELLARLRAVENGRWLLRCASSGRSEVINPRGQPSAEGIEIGQTGSVVVPFAHVTSIPLGGQLYFMGPAAAAGTVLFVVVAGVGQIRKRCGKKQG